MLSKRERQGDRGCGAAVERRRATRRRTRRPTRAPLPWFVPCLRIGGVVNTQLNDGQYLDHSYGGTISGDVHPFSGTPGALGKDDLGFGVFLNFNCVILELWRSPSETRRRSDRAYRSSRPITHATRLGGPPA
jgi:hypothetical protein